MFRKLIKEIYHARSHAGYVLSQCHKNFSEYPLKITSPEIKNLEINKNTNTVNAVTIPTNVCEEIIFEKKKEERTSVLETCEEDLSHVAPYLQPTFNFAAYVNKSETLQNLVKMGVNLHKIEKISEAPEFILSMDFERDMKNHIMFFHDLGLSVEAIANLITKNPFIFKEDIENLEVRINYLKYKKFSDEAIQRILERNPHWLSFTTQDIDKKLGFIQKRFQLSGNEVRLVIAKKPGLVTYKPHHIEKNLFVVKEEMGFSTEEVKKIVIECPNIFMKNQDSILKTFEYLHKQMKLPLDVIAEVPQILTCRASRVRQRHLFLLKLGKIQFDPNEPNFISIKSIVEGDDASFCVDVAKSSIQAYNLFLKTL